MYRTRICTINLFIVFLGKKHTTNNSMSSLNKRNTNKRIKNQSGRQNAQLLPVCAIVCVWMRDRGSVKESRCLCPCGGLLRFFRLCVGISNLHFCYAFRTLANVVQPRVFTCFIFRNFKCSSFPRRWGKTEIKKPKKRAKRNTKTVGVKGMGSWALGGGAENYRWIDKSRKVMPDLQQN